MVNFSSCWSGILCLPKLCFKIQFPTREGPVTPMDEAKVRDMMEVRNRQQQLYDAAAKELDEKRKQEPPPKVGPISKQIAAKAKLRPEYNPLTGYRIYYQFQWHC